MLPYTNADVGYPFNAASFKKYAAHCTHCMHTSAKLFFASVAACINGFIPRAFKYTAMSTCLSIIEDDLQKNRVPVPVPIPATRLQSALNDIIITFDTKTE